MLLLIVSYVVAGLIVFAAIMLAIKTTIIKSPSTNSNPPYSFGRTQLMWWTIIVGATFVILYGKTGNYDLINQSTLILLSIGLVTTAGGSIIDAGQQQSNIVRHQDASSKGFWLDILSDDSGVSMHRFQAVMFNVIFGVTFLATFWIQQKFPDFNNSELMLMGISSGAYLALKTNENKTTNTTNTNTNTNTTEDTPPKE